MRVLDVGCGPVSHVGTRSDRWIVEVTGVDPLADHYRALCREFGLEQQALTWQGEVEALTGLFPEDSFDIVYCRNALDHTRDPLLGIHQMVKVLRADGACWMIHSTDEGEKQRYRGLHQWNFRALEDGDLVVWAPGKGERSLRQELRGAAAVAAEILPDGWHTVTITKAPAAARTALA